MEEADLIFYQFSRSKIERGDFSHFLGLYSLDKLPTGRRLRQMINRIVFCVDGYDDDSREIHTIPEVRRFYRTLLMEKWPFALYFANLDTDIFRAVTFCCLDGHTTVQADARPHIVAIQHDRLPLVQFLSQQFGGMNIICERAGLFESRIYERSKAVFEYFGLPYQAENPKSAANPL